MSEVSARLPGYTQDTSSVGWTNNDEHFTDTSFRVSNHLCSLVKQQGSRHIEPYPHTESSTDYTGVYQLSCIDILPSLKGLGFCNVYPEGYALAASEEGLRPTLTMVRCPDH